MRMLSCELKTMGRNVFSIYLAVTSCFGFLACFGGSLLNLSILGFEVVFPFLLALSIGEWGKIRADENFDIIAAQCNSLFRWVGMRFIAVFAAGSLFALISIVIVAVVRKELPLGEMVLMYISPAFLLSSIGVLAGLCFAREHVASLLCGILWILTMLAQSLLRFPGTEYVYLFIRYAGDINDIWMVNKLVLLIFGLVLWVVIYLVCRKRIVLP